MPSFLLNVPRLAQRSRSDCLPTCVEMVLAYHGQAVDAGWLRRVLQSTDIGTPGFKVLNLQRHGYVVTYGAATDERVLWQALAAGTPPIILIRTAALPYWNTVTAHAVVVVGGDDDAFIVNDPTFAQQPQRIAHNVFMLAWSDFDFLWTLIIPHDTSDIA